MYGMDKSKRDFTLNKINRNKQYLINNGIELDNIFIPFSDFCKNQYLNTNRYVAEINNRVYSLFEYAKELNLTNIFFTLTLPTEYHKYKKVNIGKKNERIVKNPKFIDDNDHNPKSGTLELSRLFKKFMDSRIYKKIPKDKRVYFRVTEPHADGTPHLHVSFFIPKEYAVSFVQTLADMFPFPQGKIVESINNPVAYLMKYILKTFDDYSNGDAKITDLSLWFVYWGISRIYTSRTLISLNIYRVLGGKYSLLNLTKMYKNKTLNVLFDANSNKLQCIGINDDKNGFIAIWTRKIKNNNPNFNNMRQESKPRIRKKIKRILVTCNNEKFMLIDNKLHSLLKQTLIPSKTADYELLKYYNQLDIEQCPLPHFGLVQNELISRGLINGVIQSLNKFNNEFKPIKAKTRRKDKLKSLKELVELNNKEEYCAS